MKQFTRMISLVVLAALLAACGGGGGGSSISMTDAAKQFLEGTFKGDKDKVLAVVCAAYKVAAEASFAAGAMPAGAEVDLSGLEFKIAKESGNDGEVAVSGKIKVTAAGQSQELDLAQMGGAMTNVTMKNESGWKVCPTAPTAP